MSAGQCVACGADVLWAWTGRKRMPIDPAPTEDGNLAVYRDHLGQIRVRVLKTGEQLATHERRGIAHFATCPHADRFRKRKVPAADVRRPGVYTPPGATVDLPKNVTPIATRRRTRS